MARKTGLTAAEKAAMVLEYLRREDSAAKLARRYGVSEQTLYRYKDEFLKAGTAGLAGNVDAERRIRELEQAVEAREQVIGELTIANRILKKRSEALS